MIRREDLRLTGIGLSSHLVFLTGHTDIGKNAIGYADTFDLDPFVAPGFPSQANAYLTLKVPSADKSVAFCIAIWKGPAKLKSEFEKYCRKTALAIPAFEQGGQLLWRYAVTTKLKFPQIPVLL